MLIPRVTLHSLPPLNEVNGQKPREIAARVLGRRPDSDEYTETLLERSLTPTRLSPADRGLTQELVFGVVRWQATLDWLIDRKTTGPQAKGRIAGFVAARALPNFLARPYSGSCCRS